LDSLAQNSDFLWFALHVRTRYERVAATLISGKRYECFLPTYLCRRQWSDRIKEIELPLFPGYLFCRFDPLQRLPILTVPGVISIVGVAKTPVPVDQAEIASLRVLVNSRLDKEPWPYLRIGQAVRIEHGALRGLEGILSHVGGRHRIIVSVTLLQRSVAVELDSAWVTALQQGPFAYRTGPVQPTALRFGT
jgi:transcription antitermination factor NusG